MGFFHGYYFPENAFHCRKYLPQDKALYIAKKIFQLQKHIFQWKKDFLLQKKLVALLLLSYKCLVTVNVLWLFPKVPWVGMQCVIVVFSNHTTYFFNAKNTFHSSNNYFQLHMFFTLLKLLPLTKQLCVTKILYIGDNASMQRLHFKAENSFLYRNTFQRRKLLAQKLLSIAENYFNCWHTLHTEKDFHCI